MNWTISQVLSLTANAATQTNGQKLAKGTSLSSLGTDGEFLWGECQGSGKTAYSICIDLADGAAKCSCPAKQFPCKHTLGMFLYFISTPQAFHTLNPPSWASLWANNRKNKKSVETVLSNPADIALKQQNKSERETEKITAFSDDIEDALLWVEDIIRIGIANVEKNYNGFGEAQKSWMSNAKVEGLRSLIDEMSRLIGTGENTEWTEKFLLKAGELYFTFKLLKSIEKLPKDFVKSFYQFIGFNENKRELLSEKGITDNWIILGSVFEEVEDRHNLIARRIWLYGKQAGITALILDFGFGGNFTEQYGPTGSCFQGEVVFYPGILRQRALVKTQTRTPKPFFPLFKNTEDNLQQMASQLSVFPWFRQFPFLLSDMVLVSHNKKWFLADKSMKIIPIKASQNKVLHILALSGNEPFHVFGEWHESFFSILTIFTKDRISPLNHL